MSKAKTKYPPDIELVHTWWREKIMPYKTFDNLAKAFFDNPPRDLIHLMIKVIEDGPVQIDDKRSFAAGVILGYEYSKYKIEKLNALNRNNLQK